MQTDLEELKEWLREFTLDLAYLSIRTKWADAIEKLQADLKKHDAWLGQAHALCADIGVPPGHIEDRLFEAIGKVRCATDDDLATIAYMSAKAESRAEIERLLAKIKSLRDGMFAASSLADGSVPDEIDREELARLDGIIAGAK